MHDLATIQAMNKAAITSLEVAQLSNDELVVEVRNRVYSTVGGHMPNIGSYGLIGCMCGKELHDMQDYRNHLKGKLKNMFNKL